MLKDTYFGWLIDIDILILGYNYYFVSYIESQDINNIDFGRIKKTTVVINLSHRDSFSIKKLAQFFNVVLIRRGVECLEPKIILIDTTNCFDATINLPTDC